MTRELMARMSDEKPFKHSRFEDDRIFFSSEYDRLNPATSDVAGEEYQQYLKEFMRRLKSKSPEEQKRIQQKFDSQNGMGGGAKNIYAQFVDKDDHNTVN